MKKLLCIVFFLPLYVWAQAQIKDVKPALEFQQELNREFSDPLSSPLDSADRLKFISIPFFAVDTHFIVTATFVRTKKEKKFKMKTTTSRTPEYIKYGEVHFTLDGKQHILSVYRNIELSKRKEFRDYLFLPFTDLTSGGLSYGGGRYLDLRIPSGNQMVLDFNKAYNPYCAYNHAYSCPIPPPENFVDAFVNAGVKEGLIVR